MNKRVIAVVAIILVAVVAGLSLLFFEQTEQGKRAAVIEKPEPAAALNEKRARAETAPPRSTPPRPAPEKPEGKIEYDHFRVGKRNVKAMLADDSLMWIGTSGGVIRYDLADDNYTLFDNKKGLLSNGVFHLSKIKNEIWVGTYGGGLSIFNPDTENWRNYNIPDGMGDAFVYDVLQTSSGDIWIATWSGANRVKGGNLDSIESWELYTVANTDGGLPNDWVYGLAQGRNGEIWLATEGGLARFWKGQWTNWNHANGLGASYEIVKADIPFKNDPGKSSAHHARQKKEQGLENVDIAYNPNYVIALAVDGQGKVWAGTWGAGLSVFDGQKWKTYTKKDGLPDNHVFMLNVGPQGHIWVGTNKGLTRFDGKEFITYDRRHGLYADNVFSMAFTRDGAMWIGSYGGVARYRRGISPAKKVRH